jgi:hypothetical protein
LKTYVLTSVLVPILATVPGPVLVLALSCRCHLCSVPLLLSPGPSLASKHRSSSVVARHSFRDLTLKLSGVRVTVREIRQQAQSPQVLCLILRPRLPLKHNCVIKYLPALPSILDYHLRILMHHNFWFYDFIQLLPTIRTIEDPTILEEVEIAVQLGNEISATRIGYDDETCIWAIR